MYTIITARGRGTVRTLQAAVNAISSASSARVVDRDGVLRARRSKGHTEILDQHGFPLRRPVAH